MIRALVLVFAACQSTPAPSVPGRPPYDGATTCGPIMTPSPELGYAERVQGSLDKSIISRPIKARHAAFRACYEAALARDPRLEGQVLAKFAVMANGRIGSVEIRGFDRDVDACMCAEVAKLEYPKFGSARFGSIYVSYPFNFRLEAPPD